MPIGASNPPTHGNRASTNGSISRDAAGGEPPVGVSGAGVVHGAGALLGEQLSPLLTTNEDGSSGGAAALVKPAPPPQVSLSSFPK